MSKRLDELNMLVSEYIGGHNRADETLFELGVELGRELQKLEIAKYRLPFFEIQAQSVNAEKVKRNYIKQLNSTIKNQVLKAARAHLEECGSITFNASHHRRDYEKLDDAIGERFGIRNTRVSQTTVGGDFEIYFTFVGKLQNYFTDNKISPEFYITLYNSYGEDSETVDEVDDEGYPFGSVSCGLQAHYTNQSVEFIKNFCDGFEKQILMHYLSVK
jgi:hypothetical protein